MRLHSTAALAATLALGLGASACGGEEETTTTERTPAAPAVEPVAKIDALSGRSTAVALDGDFVSALESLKLTPGTVGAAEIKGGAARFPITGGNVTYFKPGTKSPYVQGRIDHRGSGLRLEGAGKRVELTDFVVDPGASVLTGTVTVDGKQAATDAPLFFLDGRTLQPLKTRKNGTAILEGTTVKLKAEAAELLNKTFGVTALEEGLVIGTAKITVNTA